MINEKKIESILDEILNISFEAGEILLSYQKRRHELIIQNKGIEGIATEADKATEEYIISSLRPLLPEAEFLAEESSSGLDLDKILNTDYYWIIDPLDGTNNFVNGLPIFASSIALFYRGKPIIGVVYNPLSGECFFAAEGKGAYFVDYRVNPLKKFLLKKTVNDKASSDCVFSPAPAYEKENKFESQIESFKKNIVGARAVRRLGCATIEICYVAKGNFDGYWEKGLKPWDTAAAWIVCSESGVKLTDFFGRDFSIKSDSILVARDNLHGKILGKISKN